MVLEMIPFVVELVMFIGRPIWAELKVWNTRSSEIGAGRKRLAWLLLGVFLMVALIPWRSSMRGAGVVHAALQQIVCTPLAGRLLELPKTAQVTEGQILFVLESPGLSIAGQRAGQLAQTRAKELVGLMGLPDGESLRASPGCQNSCRFRFPRVIRSASDISCTENLIHITPPNSKSRPCSKRGIAARVQF